MVWFMGTFLPQEGLEVCTQRKPARLLHVPYDLQIARGVLAGFQPTNSETEAGRDGCLEVAERLQLALQLCLRVHDCGWWCGRLTTALMRMRGLDDTTATNMRC